MTLKIGPYKLDSPVLAAPMAGVSDAVYRQLAVDFGAALAVSEMINSNPQLQHSNKTRWRMSQINSNAIRSVQIVGHDPQMMAQAAKLNVDHGAQIIDINMGCPAKKVCNKLAGSALLTDPDQVARILDAVVCAVDVPVTLKMRTGPDPNNRNGLNIAQIAENSGITALSIHGRTRACRFKGEVEYSTIRDIKQIVKIPIIANGDIDSADKARQVLKYTGADAVMIGRGAQGNPWLFRQIKDSLQNKPCQGTPSMEEIAQVLLSVLTQMYSLYGEYSGVRIARKHIAWYTNSIPGNVAFRKSVNLVESSAQQFKMTYTFFQNNCPNIKIAA